MKLPAPVKLSFVTDFINAKLRGDSQYEITGINEIHVVNKGDLTFVDHPKYYDKVLNSAASVILINKDIEPPAGKHLLICDDPFQCYNKLTKHFLPFESSKKLISDSATIGKGVVLQPGIFIGNNVKIGDDCLIHSNVSIYDNSIIGNRVIIHANAVIGSDAFYYKKLPSGYDKMHSCGRVVIEDDVEIGAGCTIDKGVSGDTVIGKGSKFDNHVHIGHDTVVGKNVLIAAQTGIAGVTKIEDDVILWGQVGVNKDLVIGKGAVVYAQSGVASSIEGGKNYFGSPVQEAREKMKELAYTKRLKELFNKKS